MENKNYWVSTVKDTSVIGIQKNYLYATVEIASKAECQKQLLAATEGCTYYIGSDENNSIQIESRLVSEKHGALHYQNGQWYYADLGSTNGTIVDSQLYYAPDSTADVPKWHALILPCILKIDHPDASLSDHVEITLNSDSFSQKEKYVLSQTAPCIIGRASTCQINIPHVTVSRMHAIISYSNGSYYIDDYRSTNGLTVNSTRVSGRTKLKIQDVIRVGRTILVFMGTYLDIIRPNTEGVSVSARGIDKYVYERKGMRKKKKVLLHNVSLDIQPGELVAIIGGSGAGKTTLMNTLSKFTEKQGGTILIDGQDLDKDYASLKDMIGYVPQQDIVYEQLPLQKMLDYAARMRMPSDTSASERKKRILEVLDLVQLTEHKNSLISKLSGGQKKRASIAVELLADPSLFFLDEPTSGLDAGTEEKLMQSLHNLAKNGKTVILVTHSTLKLDICDRIIAMGRGGRLCFSGDLQEAKDFFQVERVPEIYEKLDNESEQWEYKFQYHIKKEEDITKQNKSKPKNGIGGIKQYGILTNRYAQIMLRNKKQLLGIVGQAIIFAFVLALVSKDDLYVEFAGTQTVNFVTACLAMWMGLFLAIQEITKERGILRREYMANLKRIPYLLSKVTVLGALSALQIVVFQLSSYGFSVLLDKNLPNTSVFLPPYIENGITIFLVAIASVCMGLLISAIAKQPERITPYVLMPQIVLSGVLFDLGEAFNYIKCAVFTYWGNRALCISADVNQLGENQMGIYFETLEEYTSTASGLFTCWGALVLLATIMLLIAYFVLYRLRKDER